MRIFCSPRIFFIVVVLALSSCSSSYKPMMLERFAYQDDQVHNDVKISYAHNLQHISKNKWYAKKERKFKMIAVAVRVENNTDEAIELSPVNLKVYGPNGESKLLYTPHEYGDKVKQRTGRHMLHALYGLWINNIFIPFGAAIGIGNAVRARKANRNNIINFDSNAIWNRVVEPGEVVYGTILMGGVHGDELNFVYER